MKYRVQKRRECCNHRFLFCGSLFLLLLIVLAAGIPSKKTYAKTVTVMVENSGKITAYTSKGHKVTVNNQSISTSSIPSVKIKNIWMVSAQEVFGNGLGCNYQYDQASGKLRITNSETGAAAELTVNSKSATIDGTARTMPAKAMLATNGNSGKTGVLVPAKYLAKKLGFTFSASEKKLSFKKLTLYLQYTENSSYNTKLYQNSFLGISLAQNSSMTRQTLSMDTSEDTSSANLTITENETTGVITYTYLNTYNLLGEISKDFSSVKGSQKLVTKLTITQSGNNTVVTINYNKDYSYMTSADNFGGSCSFSTAAYSLKVKLPEGVAFSSVTTTDRYDIKKIILKIPGNWKTFYNDSENLILNNNIIQNISISGSSSKTKITIATKKLQGFALTDKTGYFTVTLDTPRKIYKNIVVLDPGHGGKDDGASNRGTKEKNLNYKILYTLGKKYFESDTSDIKVYYTRTKDIFIPLMDRAKFASQVGADLFISLHMNSSVNSSANGMEVYYSKENNKANASGLTSKKMAKLVLNHLLDSLDASNRGVKSARFVVTRYNTVPSILIELGFLSGSSDYKKLTDSNYQKNAAKAIYEAVRKLFDKYPTNR